MTNENDPLTGSPFGLRVQQNTGVRPCTSVQAGAVKLWANGIVGSGSRSELTPNHLMISDSSGNSIIELNSFGDGRGIFSGVAVRTGGTYTLNGLPIIDSSGVFVGGGIVMNHGINISANGIICGAMTVGSNQVVGARKTGWTTPTGTISRGAFSTDTIPLTVAGLQSVARRLVALETDLRAHGLIGA